MINLKWPYRKLHLGNSQSDKIIIAESLIHSIHNEFEIFELKPPQWFTKLFYKILLGSGKLLALLRKPS